MPRLTTALAAGLVATLVVGDAGFAADLGPYRAPAPARAERPVEGYAAGAVRARPEYSYYGEYGYPAPFGYGYAYAPTPGRNMEYGYYGPRYVVFAPDTYRGPILGYHEW